MIDCDNKSSGCNSLGWEQKMKHKRRIILARFSGLLWFSMLMAFFLSVEAKNIRALTLETGERSIVATDIEEISSSTHIRLLGGLGTSYTINEVEIYGDFAYASIDPELEHLPKGVAILKIGDEPSLTPVGFINFDKQPVQDLLVVGDNIVVKQDNINNVYTLADPLQWKKVSDLGTGEVISFEWPNIYLVRNGYLVVYDLTNPKNPGLLLTYPIFEATNYIVEDGILILTTQFFSSDPEWIYTLKTIDLFSVGGPQVLDSVERQGSAYFLLFRKNYIYVYQSYFSEDGLHAYNVTDPTNIEEAESFWVPSTYCGYRCYYIHPIALHDDYLFHENAVARFVSPTEVVGVPIPSSRYVTDAAVSGKYILQAWEREGLDLSIETGDGEYESTHYGTNTKLRDVVVKGTTAYTIGDVFQVIDVSKPMHPTLQQTIPISGSIMVLTGDYIYLDTGRILDVSDPMDPVVSQTTLPSTFGDSTGIRGKLDLSVTGNRLYHLVPPYVHLYDLSVPFHPSLLSSIEVEVPLVDAYESIPELSAITSQGANAYVLANRYWLTLKGTISRRTSFLLSFDYSLPTSPTVIASTNVMDTEYYSYSTPATVRAHIYNDEGTMLYLLLGENLIVLDATVPISPTITSISESSDQATALTFAKDRVYIAGNVLRIYEQLSDGGLQQIGNYYSSEAFKIQGMAVQDGLIYAAAGDWGLIILEQGYHVAGIVQDVNGGAPPPIQLTLGEQFTTTTVTNGGFMIRGLDYSESAFVLEPHLSGYRFFPAYRSIVPNRDRNHQDFILLPEVVTGMLSTSATSLTYTDTQGSPTAFDFPAGSTPFSTTVSITPTVAASGKGWDFAGHAFELDAEGITSFEQPVKITLTYSDADVHVVSDESGLQLMHWDGVVWETAEATCSDPIGREVSVENKVLEVEICETGLYALYGPSQQNFFPLVAVDSPYPPSQSCPAYPCW